MPVLVLDFFGTIVSISSLARGYEAVAEALKGMGAPGGRGELAGEYARALDRLWAAGRPSFTGALIEVASGLGLGLGEAEARRLVLEALVPRLEAYPDAVEALTVAGGLFEGVAVASDGERVVVEAALEGLGLQGFIDTVATSDEVGRVKPDPAVVLLALERLGARPGDAAVLGDSWKDVEAARRARAAFAGLVVRRPLSSPGAPDAVACDLVSLVRLASTASYGVR